jgi:uncharacterized protein
MGVHAGLSYSLWLPRSAEPRGGVVVLHGAGSSKENHHDFARAAIGAELAAIVFDQRGHGESEGVMDGRAIDDVADMAALLRSRIDGPQRPRTDGPQRSRIGGPQRSRSGGPAAIALRGSSMGGYLALVSAAAVNAAAVVAICPASDDGLRRGLSAGRFTFDVDRPALDRFLAGHDVAAAARELEVPVLLLHAEGDEQVPVEHSRELAALLRSPRSRLITLPGGHHRSIQHDAEMQAVSLRFIARALEPAG